MQGQRDNRHVTRPRGIVTCTGKSEHRREGAAGGRAAQQLVGDEPRNGPRSHRDVRRLWIARVRVSSVTGSPASRSGTPFLEVATAFSAFHVLGDGDPPVEACRTVWLALRR